MGNQIDKMRAEFEGLVTFIGGGGSLERDPMGLYVDEETLQRWTWFVAGWERLCLLSEARRVPVVLPDQLPPDAAKRAMEALQTDVETLRRALAECRDAFPVPAPGSQIEPAWMQAMGHAEAVPDYMRAIAAAPVQLPDVEQGIQELLDRIEHACQNRALAAGGSIVACGLVESKREAIEQQVRQLLQAKTTVNADSTRASSS